MSASKTTFKVQNLKILMLNYTKYDKFASRIFVNIIERVGAYIFPPKPQILFPLMLHDQVKCEYSPSPPSGVNFTNILHTAFTCADPKSTKKTVKLSSFLCFWDLRL